MSYLTARYVLRSNSEKEGKMSLKKIIFIALLFVFAAQLSSCFFKDSDEKKARIQVIDFEEGFEKKKQLIADLRKRQQELERMIKEGRESEELMWKMMKERASAEVLADVTRHNLKTEQELYEKFKKLCDISQ